MVSAKFSRDHRQNRFAFVLTWLPFVFWRHVPEVDLLLHPVHEIQALLVFQFAQVVQSDIAFLRVFVMASEAIAIQEDFGFTREFEWQGCGFFLVGCRCRLDPARLHGGGQNRSDQTVFFISMTWVFFPASLAEIHHYK